MCLIIRLASISESGKSIFKNLDHCILLTNTFHISQHKYILLHRIIQNTKPLFRFYTLITPITFYFMDIQCFLTNRRLFLLIISHHCLQKVETKFTIARRKQLQLINLGFPALKHPASLPPYTQTEELRFCTFLKIKRNQTGFDRYLE